MNDDPRQDEGFVRRLAGTRPKADGRVQAELEARLMERLQARQGMNHQEEKPMTTQVMTGRGRWGTLTWAVTLGTVLVALAGIILVNLNSTPRPSALGTADEASVAVVIALEKIGAGTVIDAEMVGVASVTAADAAKLRLSEREFFADAGAVIGQTARRDIAPFQPLETQLLGEPVLPCENPGRACPVVPEGYYTIGFNMQPDVLGELVIGDRVDVLGVADGTMRVVAENVLLADIQPQLVTLAAPKWQLGVLLWLAENSDTVVLRPYVGDSLPVVADTPVEFSFIAPEVLPEDFAFDLIVNVPAEKGYLLRHLPASIDAIQFTSNGDTLHFWFKNIELVGVVDGTAVTIRLPQDDAKNLDYLIGLGMALTFVPNP